MKVFKGIKVAVLVTASAAFVASLVYDNKNKVKEINTEDK